MARKLQNSELWALIDRWNGVNFDRRSNCGNLRCLNIRRSTETDWKHRGDGVSSNVYNAGDNLSIILPPRGKNVTSGRQRFRAFAATYRGDKIY